MSSSAGPVRSRFSGYALVISNDRAAGEQISRTMQRFGFTVDVCSTMEAAAQLISMRKFQAIFLDIEDKESSELIEKIQASPSNRTAVTFAVSGGGIRSEFRSHAKFMLHRPLTEALLVSTLKASMGMIIHEYRRYFRCLIRVPASLRVAGGPAMAGEVMNISEGGVALSNCVPLTVAATVTVQFELPDTPGEFKIDAEVCWSDMRSRAGLHFSSIPPEQKARLQAWLSKRIEESLPEPVVNQ